MGKTRNPKYNIAVPAHKSFLGELLVFGMARRSLWRSFHAVYLRTAGALPAPPAKLIAPVIFYANHGTWWDGYLAHFIMRQVYGLDPYLMMDERQLKKYIFFSWAGCFSVNQADGRSALASIDYIANLLPQKSGRAMWIYPQGDITPQDARPLGFHSGLARLVRRVGDCYVCPVAHSFEFTREQYPDIFVEVGEFQRFRAGDSLPPMRVLTGQFEQTLTQQLDNLQNDINYKKLEAFTAILSGKGSTDTTINQLLRFLRKQSKRID